MTTDPKEASKMDIRNVIKSGFTRRNGIVFKAWNATDEKDPWPMPGWAPHFGVKFGDIGI